MKYFFYILLIAFFTIYFDVNVHAQCSLCTKTALQMGEKPAQGLNQGILYLMFTPLIIIGFIGYRWWRNEKKFEE
jgi:hypothetical protein